MISLGSGRDVQKRKRGLLVKFARTRHRAAGLGFTPPGTELIPTCHAITTEVTIFEVAATGYWKVCIVERIKVAVIKVP